MLLSADVMLWSWTRLQVSRPHYFVCHSWGGNFSRLVSRLKAELREDDPDNVFLWLDIFALNLHQKDRMAFKRVKDAISISKRGTIAVLDTTALKASCCLYEMWHTLDARGLQFLKIAGGNPTPVADWDEAVQAIDLYSCKATKQRDRGAILKHVNDRPGVEELNAAVRVRQLVTAGHTLPPSAALYAKQTEGGLTIVDLPDLSCLGAMCHCDVSLFVLNAFIGSRTARDSPAGRPAGAR